MSDAEDSKIRRLSPAPTDVEVVIGGTTHHLRYDNAFVLACELLEKGNASEAAKLFERMEQFVDRGPRAFIMQAFCEAAAMHFERIREPLAAAFTGDKENLADVLHSAFVSYHVGIRQDALKTMIELVNTHRELPTLCLLLGNMLNATDKQPLARKCWSLAIHRDRIGGAVAAAASRQLQRFPIAEPSGDEDTEHDRSK